MAEGSRGSAPRRPGPGGRIWWVLGTVSACVAVGVGGYLLAPARGVPTPAAAQMDAAAGVPPPLSTSGEAEVRFSLKKVKQMPSGADMLDTGAARLWAYFSPHRKIDTQSLRVQWWWRGVLVGEIGVETLHNGAGGTVCRAELVARKPKQGFGPGVVEVEARSEGKRIARGSCVCAADAKQILEQREPSAKRTRIVSVTTATGVDEAGAPVEAAKSFSPDGPVWLAFRYEGADVGAAFVVRWYCEGREIPPAETAVTASASAGWGHAWLGAGKGGLPPARYSASISYAGQSVPLAQASFTVTSSGG